MNSTDIPDPPDFPNGPVDPYAEPGMQFTPLEIEGVFVIKPKPIVDERGFFARMWSTEDLLKRGLNAKIDQASLSFNSIKGTVRGMHFQEAPHAEAKIVRCQAGAIFDVVLDLRPDSPTYKTWMGVELTAENRKMLYIPEGCAHGFQTLADATEVFYLLSQGYEPNSARGVRWDDPAFDIKWPGPVTCISERDKSHPDWE